MSHLDLDVGFVGFDLETTGVNPRRDRIVTAAVVRYVGGRAAQGYTWVADPGVEIPAQATAVHGFTTEAARASGQPAAEVVSELVGVLVDACAGGLPLVVMNAPFDLSLLAEEAARYERPSLTDILSPLVLDPRVLDKQVDPRRRGSRTLTALCEVYDVPHGGAHDALADAVAACALTEAILVAYPRLAGMPLKELHDAQVRWAADQQASLREYFAKTAGKQQLAHDVRTEWPLIPNMRPGSGR
ncbi:exonuclease domain-containing protein [Embleya sp. NPDC001921]